MLTTLLPLERTFCWAGKFFWVLFPDRPDQPNSLSPYIPPLTCSIRRLPWPGFFSALGNDEWREARKERALFWFFLESSELYRPSCPQSTHSVSKTNMPTMQLAGPQVFFISFLCFLAIIFLSKFLLFVEQIELFGSHTSTPLLLPPPLPLALRTTRLRVACLAVAGISSSWWRSRFFRDLMGGLRVCPMFPSWPRPQNDVHILPACFCVGPL